MISTEEIQKELKQAQGEFERAHSEGERRVLWQSAARLDVFRRMLTLSRLDDAPSFLKSAAGVRGRARNAEERWPTAKIERRSQVLEAWNQLAMQVSKAWDDHSRGDVRGSPRERRCGGTVRPLGRGNEMHQDKEVQAASVRPISPAEALAAWVQETRRYIVDNLPSVIFEALEVTPGAGGEPDIDQVADLTAVLAEGPSEAADHYADLASLADAYRQVRDVAQRLSETTAQ